MYSKLTCKSRRAEGESRSARCNFCRARSPKNCKYCSLKFSHNFLLPIVKRTSIDNAVKVALSRQQKMDDLLYLKDF